MSNLPREYLGDGVYVAYDGYQLILTAEGSQHTAEGSQHNVIYMDPYVYVALEAFVKKLAGAAVEAAAREAARDTTEVK